MTTLLWMVAAVAVLGWLWILSALALAAGLVLIGSAQAGVWARLRRSGAFSGSEPRPRDEGRTR